MTYKKTVFVVGAGASKEAGLPTGGEIKDKIKSCLDIKHNLPNTRNSGQHIGTNPNSVIVRDALIKHVPSIASDAAHPYLEAARHIRRAMPQAGSIDDFIHAQRNKRNSEAINLCGKLAIVSEILSSERNSLLCVNRTKKTINFSKIEKTWYVNFMKWLAENSTVDDIEDRLAAISFVIFNYDRCIEHFLFHSLQNYYHINKEDAINLINSINIYHPYGTVGVLPWQYEEKSLFTDVSKLNQINNLKMDFGNKPTPAELLQLADRIQTFTESKVQKSKEMGEARNKIVEADNIVFLGFAFHKINMDLIKPPGSLSPIAGKAAYFATAKGISDSDCQQVIKELKKFRYEVVDRDEVLINNKLACSDLFYEYKRSLSFTQNML